MSTQPYVLIVPYDCNVHLLIRSRSADENAGELASTLCFRKFEAALPLPAVHLVFSRARVGRSNPDGQTRTVTACFCPGFQVIKRSSESAISAQEAFSRQKQIDSQHCSFVVCICPGFAAQQGLQLSSQLLRRNYETLMGVTYKMIMIVIQSDSGVESDIAFHS